MTKLEEKSRPGLIAGIWAVLMFSVFPLIFTDFYFNILETKFITLCIINFGMMGGLLWWGISSGKLAAWRKETKETGRKPELSPADWCMTAFLFCAIVSTINAAPYREQAFTGVEGRYTGLFYILMLTGTWFCITRFLRFRMSYITVFLVVSCVVAILGITDYYDLNLLHFKDMMREDEYEMFTSTIGNINTYVVLIGLFMAMSGSLFVLSPEKPGRIAFYLVCLVISFLAVTTGSSDNGYLSLGAFFAFLPFAAFRTRTGFRRWIMTLAVYLTSLLFIIHEAETKTGQVLRIDGVFQVLRKIPHLGRWTLLVWNMYAVLLILELVLKRRAEKLPAGKADKTAGKDVDTTAGKSGDKTAEKDGPAEPDLLPAAVRVVWGILVAAAAVFVLYLLVSANRMTMKEAYAAYGPAAQYLKFSDAWGTNRGYVWRAAIEEYKALPVSKQITGSGPDTFGIYMMIHRWKEMQEKTGQIFDSAHNEYLQFLFTVGPLGLLSYIGVLLFSIADAFRAAFYLYGKKDGDRTMAAVFCAFAVTTLCYAFQATVNINIPISTPLLWVLLMISGACVRALPPGAVRKMKRKKDQNG